MTKGELIRHIVNDCNPSGMEADSWEALVELAYWMGRESASREVSDMYRAHIAAQKQRASACRYSHMAAAVVGPEDYLYHSDYSGYYSPLFTGDKTDLRASF